MAVDLKHIHCIKNLHIVCNNINIVYLKKKNSFSLYCCDYHALYFMEIDNYWLSYVIFLKCLQILCKPLQIFSTELQNSLRYSAGQGLIIRTLFLILLFEVISLIIFIFHKVLYLIHKIAHKPCKYTRALQWQSINAKVSHVHEKDPMLNLRMITQLSHSPRVHLVHPTLFVFYRNSVGFFRLTKVNLVEVTDMVLKCCRLLGRGVNVCWI